MCSFKLAVLCFYALTCIYVLRLVFRNYDPNFIAGSLDEAYLDITEVCRERGLSGGEVSLRSGFVFFCNICICFVYTTN